MSEESNNFKPYIWFGILGALLSVINSIVATISLGVFQGPIVAFTTPFTFALAKFMYPRKPGATLVYLPVIVLSFFTLNFGPPGFYKLVYLLGAILYDIVSYVLSFHKHVAPDFKIWKLIIAVSFYPIGLFLGALFALRWIVSNVEIPILSKGLIGAVFMVILFIVIGGFATISSYKIYRSFLFKEIIEYTDET